MHAGGKTPVGLDFICFSVGQITYRQAQVSQRQLQHPQQLWVDECFVRDFLSCFFFFWQDVVCYHKTLHILLKKLLHRINNIWCLLSPS